MGDNKIVDVNEFLRSELRDNNLYNFPLANTTEERKKYRYIVNNDSKNNFKKNGNIKFINSREFDDIHCVLYDVSHQLPQLLTDKKFVDKNIILFNEKEYEHNSSIFIEYQPKILNSLEKANLQTSNLVGKIVKRHNNKSYSITISSRFGDDFLMHLISSTHGFLEIPNQGTTKTSGIAEWLLIYLWKAKLKKAYSKGLPKEYVTKKDKIPSIRGRININQIIKNPKYIPPYDCEYREHSYNNPITQLISNTFRLIKNKELIADCHKIRQDFLNATNGERIPINQLLSTKNIKNPYYNEYNELIDLSKRIIKKELADFADQSNEFSAFLFDISMLFEYFIRKILLRKGYILETKKDDFYFIPSGGVYRNGRRKLEPDIIIQNDDGSIDVFDVKYKNFDFYYGVKREDLFQLHTYIGRLSNEKKINRCGFIYPIVEDNEKWNKKNIFQKMTIGGQKIDFEVRFFEVPKEGSDDYSKRFYESIDNFMTDNFL